MEKIELSKIINDIYIEASTKIKDGSEKHGMAILHGLLINRLGLDDV